MSFDEIAQCLSAGLAYLQLSAAPAIALVDEFAHPGGYVPSTVILRRDASCGVLWHELLHHKQFASNGWPKSVQERRDREAEAHRFDLMVREQ